nr:hypothetical protein [Tanacetum cinerariifolium]
MVKNLDNVNKFLMYPRKPKRNVNEVPQPSDPTSVANEAVNEEMNDSLERATTTATSLDTEQDREVNIPRSGEDSLKLTELMELCTKLQQRVLDLETTKTTQAIKIESLKRIVKNLKRRKRSRTHGLKRLYKVGLSIRVESSEDEGLGEKDASKLGRIADIDANEDIIIVKSRKKEEQTTNTSSTKKNNVYLPQEYRRKEAHRFEEQDFDSIQKMFDRAFKRVNTFVDYRTELVEESSEKHEADVIEGRSKRAGTELEQENVKKQKIDDDKEIAKLQQLVKIIPDEEGVAIDAIPLAVKPPSIVD